MAREKYELAEEDYINGMKYKEIAEKYDVSINTVKSWKTRYKWCKDKKSMHTKNKKVCTQNKSGASIKKNKENIKEPIADEVKNDGLTEKQRLFILYYVKYRNQVKAYQKAYKCSYESACSNASALWKNSEIQKEIDKFLDELRSDIKFDIRDLIKMNMDIVCADIKDYVDFGKKPIPITLDDGSTIEVESNYVDFRNAEEVDGTIISEVKKGKDGVSIKLLDKQKAMDFLDKHLEYLSPIEKLKFEYAKLQNEKLKVDIEKTKAETNRITENDEIEVEDDGFLEALKGRTTQVWSNE